MAEEDVVVIENGEEMMDEIQLEEYAELVDALGTRAVRFVTLRFVTLR
jgi:hypothetical protein